MGDLGRFCVFDFLGIFQKPSKTYQNLLTLVVTTGKAPVVTRYMLSFSPQLQGTHFGTGFPPKRSLISEISTKTTYFQEFSSLRKIPNRISSPFSPLLEKETYHTDTFCGLQKVPFFLASQARTFGMNSFFHEFKIHAPFGSPGCR